MTKHFSISLSPPYRLHAFTFGERNGKLIETKEKPKPHFVFLIETTNGCYIFPQSFTFYHLTTITVLLLLPLLRATITPSGFHTSSCIAASKQLNSQPPPSMCLPLCAERKRGRDVTFHAPINLDSFSGRLPHSNAWSNRASP